MSDQGQTSITITTPIYENEVSPSRSRSQFQRMKKNNEGHKRSFSDRLGLSQRISNSQFRQRMRAPRGRSKSVSLDDTLALLPKSFERYQHTFWYDHSHGCVYHGYPPQQQQQQSQSLHSNNNNNNNDTNSKSSPIATKRNNYSPVMLGSPNNRALWKFRNGNGNGNNRGQQQTRDNENGNNENDNNQENNNNEDNNSNNDNGNVSNKNNGKPRISSSNSHSQLIKLVDPHQSLNVINSVNVDTNTNDTNNTAGNKDTAIDNDESPIKRNTTEEEEEEFGVAAGAGHHRGAASATSAGSATDSNNASVSGYDVNIHMNHNNSHAELIKLRSVSSTGTFNHSNGQLVQTQLQARDSVTNTLPALGGLMANSNTLVTRFSNIDAQDIIMAFGDASPATGTAADTAAGVGVAVAGIGGGSELSGVAELTELNELPEVPKINAASTIRSDVATQNITIPGSVIESPNMDSVNGGDGGDTRSHSNSDNNSNKEKHEKNESVVDNHEANEAEYETPQQQPISCDTNGTTEQITPEQVEKIPIGSINDAAVAMNNNLGFGLGQINIQRRDDGEIGRNRSDNEVIGALTTIEAVNQLDSLQDKMITPSGKSVKCASTNAEARFDRGFTLAAEINDYEMKANSNDINNIRVPNFNSTNNSSVISIVSGTSGDTPNTNTHTNTHTNTPGKRTSSHVSHGSHGSIQQHQQDQQEQQQLHGYTRSLNDLSTIAKQAAMNSNGISGNVNGLSTTRPAKKIVFFEMKIKRISEIDTTRETFRCRFHYYLTWLCTKREFQNYSKWKKSIKSGNSKMDIRAFRPDWTPKIQWTNAVEIHEHFQDGRYQIKDVRAKGFGSHAWRIDSKYLGFDPTLGRWNRVRYEADISFAEELELPAFPFDCQDFTLYLKIEKDGTDACDIVPFPRQGDFCMLDPQFSVLSEWDLENIVCEFGHTDPIKSKASKTYALASIHIKSSRRWEAHLGMMIVTLCMFSLGIGTFAQGLEGEELGNRLSFCVTFLLADVATLQLMFQHLPNIPYWTILDYYIYSCFVFLFLVTIWSCLAGSSEFFGNFDFEMFIFFCCAYIISHAVFVGMSIYYRAFERQKLTMTDEQLLKHFGNNKTQRDRRAISCSWDENILAQDEKDFLQAQLNPIKSSIIGTIENITSNGRYHRNMHKWEKRDISIRGHKLERFVKTDSILGNTGGTSSGLLSRSSSGGSGGGNSGSSGKYSGINTSVSPKLALLKDRRLDKHLNEHVANVIISPRSPVSMK